MRFLWLLAGLSLAGAVLATGDQTAAIKRIAPEVVFSVEQVPGTGEVVQLHYVGDTFDEASLQKDAQALATSLGSAVNSFQFYPATGEAEAKAIFVTDYMLDPSQGDIRLQPLVRAFSRGKGGRHVKSFSVTIVGQTPSAYTTLQTYNSPNVALKAFDKASQASIEYRILALNDDPNKVEIPPKHVPTGQITSSEGRQSGRAPLLFALVTVASVSAGALVYFAVLGKRP